MRQQQEYDWLIKIMLIGDSGVGKTNMLLRFCDNSFEPIHISTQGVEFKMKTIDVEGKKIKMQIWDTSGREVFKSVTPTYYKGAIGFFLVYSVNEKDTFKNITYWMNTIKQHTSEKVFPILIGNKIDESNRQVTQEEGEALAEQFGIPFLEISAKEGTDVADAFNTICKQVKAHRLNEEISQKNQIQHQEQTSIEKQKEEVEVQQIQQQQEVVELFKVLIVGDSGVGKTNIMLRFCQNSFQPSYLSTMGVDFKIKTLDDEGKKLKLQVWDTSGQERFRTVTQTYYKGAQAIILVYSVDDRESFKNITNWMSTIEQWSSENVCVMLIGNKIDASHRWVTKEEGEDLAKQFGIPFFETSAKEGTSVTEAFYAISKSLTSHQQTRVLSQKNQTLQINQQPIQKSQEDDEVKHIEQKQEVFETFKILIVGDSGVGKTNILLRFCDNSFQSQYCSTIGIDFKIKSIEEQGNKIKMQIWDTSGQERFKTITQSYYKGAMGIILVYSINEKESFNNIKNWVKEISHHAGDDVCKLLIGNKIDISKRQVTYEEGEDLAKQFGIPFFETSAKDGSNVQDAFYAMAKYVKVNLQKLETSQAHQTQSIEQIPAPKEEVEVEVELQEIEQKQEEHYECFKALIIGDSGVGKTNILLRFCDNIFQSSYISTIGVDFKIKTMEVEGNNIKMQIWDTSGQERFKTITQSYYKGAMAILLVYSVDDKESFNNIKNWMKEITHHSGGNVCKLLIGNKIDISQRQVTYEEGESLAKQFEISFFETSTKEGTNVADVFYQMAKSVIANIKKDETSQQCQTKQIEQPKEEQVEVQAIQQKQDVQSKIFKTLIIGDAGVGKTNILLRFCDNSFQSSYVSTIGIDFKIKSIEEDGSLIKMQIWDTSGQERFKTITQTYYRGAMAIILVYSVDDKESFKNIKNWINAIEQHTNKNVCKLLIGNKIDASNRQVTRQEGEELAKQLGIPFFETSAKMGTDVANAFYAISKLVKAQLDASN